MVSEELINFQYVEAGKKFKKLNSPEKCEVGWRIKGHIDVIDDEGGYWDTYEVRIIIPDGYPEQLPILIETSKKIERHEDWHNTDGICCLSTNAKMFTTLKGDITLLRWLEKFAHPFLANHVYKIKTNAYASSEFEHGTAGLLQGYFEIFETLNVHEVIRMLRLMSGCLPMSKNAKCFCGSGKKYKRCFLLNPNIHYQKIPLQILKADLYHIKKYLNKK